MDGLGRLARGRRGSWAVVSCVFGALSAALATWGGSAAWAGDLDVLITEVHYNVFRDGAEADLEFVEVHNQGATRVEIGGWSFAEGIDYTFPEGEALDPGEYLIVSPRPDAARAAYGVERVLGPYTGQLDNGGEVLSIVDASGRLVNRIHYDDEAPWPGRPDGRGPSLEFTGRDNGNDQGRRWKPSLGLHGTPGAPNSRRIAIGELAPPPNRYQGGILNEVRVREGGDPGFVELFNPTSAPIDLSGHTVLSSGYDFVLEVPADTSLAPGAFVVLTPPAAVPVPDVDERYVLLDAEFAIVDDLNVRAFAGRSFGRFPDGDDDASVLDASSPGAPNELGEEPSVVIHEISYHPPYVAPFGDCTESCSDRLQWIELRNVTTSAIDLSGWRLSSAVDFDFAAGTSIAANGYLVVAASVVDFSARYPGVPNVVGDWSGRLSHASESIALRDGLGNTVDRVEYADGGPTNDESPMDGTNDRTFRGSFWPPEADGDGPTLELIHPALSNRAAMAWRASAAAGGTPGAANSRFDAQPAPTVRSVEHEPAVPASGEPVRVTCRISSAASLSSAIVRWAVDGGGGASGTVDLRDDGAGVDRRANDGEYSAEIPGRNDGNVVRFAIEVADTAGESSRVPLEPQVNPYGGYPGTFYLYEVDDDAGPTSGGPVYRIVMTAADTSQLGSRPLTSNVLLPATFIAGDRAFHLVGVRYRGENSRREDNRSYKVRFHSDEAFDGIDNLNLNAGNGTQYDVSGFLESLSSDVFRRSDMPYPMIWPVALRFRGEVSRAFDTRYIHKEAFDDDFLARYFGGSDDGAFYRPRNPTFGGRSGDLQYRGEDPEEYRDIYEKRTNEEADDFSDIIALCRIFDTGETSAAEFPAAVGAAVDARQWARFFAVMACVSNTDGGIWNNNGEDFFMYRVPDDSPRPDAGKWLLLPWDLEETFQDADERLFRSTVASIQRFFSVPEHARLYYEELRAARLGAFSRLQMRQRYGDASLMFAPEDVYNVVDPIDTNVTNRIGFVDSEVSWTLEAGAYGSDSLPGVEVISRGDVWRFFRGTQQPPGGPGAWTTVGYVDATWESGPSGFGYGDGDDGTVLGDMEDRYTTVFIRREFQVADPGRVVGMTLTVDYDDGYVAYLNGVEVARSTSAPSATTILFDMTATRNHEASGGGFGSNPPESRDLGAFIGELRAGTNVLALVGLNDEAGSSDLSLIPTLTISSGEEGGGPAGGCGNELYAQGGTLRILGRCDPVATRSVSIDGEPTDVSLIIGGNGPWGAVWSADVAIEADASLLTVRAHDAVDGGGAVRASEEILIHRARGGFRPVSGTISNATTWTAEDGPYRVTGNVTIGASGILTIEPGVVVLFDQGTSIIVRGELRAVGSIADPIRMLAYTCGESWGGIAFDGTGRGGADPVHELRHVQIRDGSAPNGFGGCIAVVDSKVLVAESEVSHIRDNAIDASDAVLDVEFVHIHDIFEGVHCTNSTTRVRDCLIERMTGNSDAIDFDGSGAERSVIERCLLRDSSDDGIDLGNVTVDIRDNVLVRIEDKAISMEGPGSQGDPTITGNLIHDSGTGMAIKDGIEITEGWHNTVANCQEGVWLFAKDFAPDGGHGTFHSMIVWDNVLDLIVDARSSVAFTESNVGGGEVLPGAGNIVADPLFVNAAGGDYRLQPGSPCRGTGRDGEDMGALFGLGPVEGSFVRGDSNGNGTVELTDAVVTLDFLFRGQAGPTDCLDRLDANDDGSPDVSDAVYTLRYLFSGGPVIPAPFPEAGQDPTADGLPCGL